MKAQGLGLVSKQLGKIYAYGNVGILTLQICLMVLKVGCLVLLSRLTRHENIVCMGIPVLLWSDFWAGWSAVTRSITMEPSKSGPFGASSPPGSIAGIRSAETMSALRRAVVTGPAYELRYGVFGSCSLDCGSGTFHPGSGYPDSEKEPMKSCKEMHIIKKK